MYGLGTCSLEQLSFAFGSSEMVQMHIRTECFSFLENTKAQDPDRFKLSEEVKQCFTKYSCIHLEKLKLPRVPTLIKLQ